jgi:Peptidase family M41
MKTVTLRSVAFHEAGHFVAKHVLHRAPPYVVTICPEDDALGQNKGDLALPAEVTTTELENLLVTLFAGRAAQLRFRPEQKKEAKAGAVDDDAKATELMKLLGFSRAENRRWERSLRTRAGILVTRHWKAIRSLAHNLITYRILAGDEASLIVMASLGDKDAAGALRMLRKLKHPLLKAKP